MQRTYSWLNPLIHVNYEHDASIPCRLALVVGIDYSSPASGEAMLCTTTFSNRGDTYPAKVGVNSNAWHYIADCPSPLIVLPDDSVV